MTVVRMIGGGAVGREGLTSDFVLTLVGWVGR